MRSHLLFACHSSLPMQLQRAMPDDFRGREPTNVNSVRKAPALFWRRSSRTGVFLCFSVCCHIHPHNTLICLNEATAHQRQATFPRNTYLLMWSSQMTLWIKPISRCRWAEPRASSCPHRRRLPSQAFQLDESREMTSSRVFPSGYHNICWQIVFTYFQQDSTLPCYKDMMETASSVR